MSDYVRSGDKMSEKYRRKKNRLDVYHRGFKAYCGEVRGNGLGEMTAKASGEQKEQMETFHYRCKVELDWIERIELAMPFIARAVGENRQFILQLGNTVRIENAKKISTASVKDLARHCEYITREPQEDGSVIPEKIYVTENTGNFAVYENRFLYTLLCYIRDFTDQRQKKISELWSKFLAEVKVEKKLTIGKSKVDFKLYLKENTGEDDALSYDKETEDALARMKNIQQSVTELLNTQLMKEISASPKLKPPITKTNVLRMNMYFRGAMELYEYLTAYQGAGYTVTEHKENVELFSLEASKDFEELAVIASYLTHRYGAGIEEEMERVYEEEKLRIAREREEKRNDELRKLREQLKQDGETEKYIAALEEYILDFCEKKKLQGSEKAKKEKGFSVGEVKRRESLSTRLLDEAQNELKIYKAKAEAQEKENEELSELLRLVEARLKGVRLKYGEEVNDDDENDYLKKENFRRLEQEYKAFRSFYDKTWKNAKRNIRKTVLKNTLEKKDGESHE